MKRLTTRIDGKAHYFQSTLDDVIEKLAKYEDVEEDDLIVRAKGQWIVQSDEIGFAKWDECSVCGHQLQAVGSGKGVKYCPNCGAKMEQ